ncbi:MAG TPA: decaprenyl-phosphate phosphoribosyltransferase [Flavisolibacter sp.]|nr:decaprenyl-phosphate phosphoribosyltransferase [Flavisolibacter sp.]
MAYLKLLRPKDWAKNLFLFIPLFFSGKILEWETYPSLLLGFLAFSCMASSIYIINDYRDIEDDKKHPEKSKRPLASGAVSKPAALVICALLILTGLTLGYLIKEKFLFVLAIYFVLNLGYSFGLKSIPILDIVIVAAGFVLRVKGGAVIANVGVSEWLNIMVFLLALFMAIGKRRDDVLLKLSSGTDMRKSIKGYNLEYLNVVLALVCAVIVVAYFMYTMSPEVQNRLATVGPGAGSSTGGAYRLYYTCLFVLAGIMRYLQIIFVQAASGSPTKILYKDRFIQCTILLWIASFTLIIYMKDVTIFK